MDEAKLQGVLRAIYDACMRIEFLLDDVEDDEKEYFTDVYNTLFDLTTEIEERYGLI